MQQQLHIILGHTNLSLRAKSRTPQLIPKSHSIFYFLFSIFLTLCSIQATAQPYQWQWAINGGSSKPANGDTSWFFYSEQIYDVAIDSNNNYYFVASIICATPQLNGQPVTVYGINGAYSTNIFLFSTTCDGQVRWSQAIGGGGGWQLGYKIMLDRNNNVYVGVNVGTTSNLYPVHFSPTETLPGPPATPNTVSDYYKRTFLVKYDTNGQFVWKRALQGDVTSDNSESWIYDVEIDSNDNIHVIVGLLYGTHLNNTVTVPPQYNIISNPSAGIRTFRFKYYLVRYNSNGQLLGSMALPFDYGTTLIEPSTTFKFDEANNRYYIAGFRWEVYPNDYLIYPLNYQLSYAGTAFTKVSYILAINATNGNEIWRREIEGSLDGNSINDLVVDAANGDIYIGGKLNRKSGTAIKIIDSKNPTINPYSFNLSINGNMPFIAKLNSNGVVQWARTPTGYNSPTADSGQYYGYGLALRNNANEVAFATMGSNTVWDGFSLNRPAGHKSDPLLMRFSKQNGNVLAMHDIEGSSGKDHILTTVAVDNDGNYVVGGGYQGSLFTGGGTVNTLSSIGYYDFFVAKLAASVCGTTVSNEEFNNITVNVYPNPTNDIVNIETAESLFNYVVYDINGREIQNGMFGNNNQVNLQNVNSGVYFIKVTTTQGSTATVKVVKK